MQKLPNISEWKTENVKEFSKIFEECSLLKELPDISKWDTKSAEKMDSVFSQYRKCS